MTITWELPDNFNWIVNTHIRSSENIKSHENINLNDTSHEKWLIVIEVYTEMNAIELLDLPCQTRPHKSHFICELLNVAWDISEWIVIKVLIWLLLIPQKTIHRN